MNKYKWIPENCAGYIDKLTQRYSDMNVNECDDELSRLIKENKTIHEQDSINLNPATNMMNPKAEKILSQGLGSRPSLGYPGDKYEMGLEAIEQIEVLASHLACEVFNSKYAEVRVGSGSLANLYAFMATCQPGDNIIVPPATIGGHITHHSQGAAGLYGLNIHYAPVDKENYTIDVNGLKEQMKKIRPKLLTVGGSLNLFPHPIKQMRGLADEFGCYLHFDAAHLCGIIAGKMWQQPLDEGAHLMSFSTYKSLGGPPGGLLLTNDDDLAQRIDAIAFPGLTANFDVAKTAALAMSLLDWKVYGEEYAKTMVDAAKELAAKLSECGLEVYRGDRGATTSHQFAIEAKRYGGGQNMAKTLRKANILTSGIGLPIDQLEDDLNGLRIGTPEITRWGMTAKDMDEIALLFKQVFMDKEPLDKIAKKSSALKSRFDKISFIRN